MRKSFTRAATTAVLACLLAGGAWGTMIASDSFDYPEGDLLNNNSGVGWEEAWCDVHAAGAPKTFVFTPSLDYKDAKGTELATAGQQVGIAYDASRTIKLDTAARPELADFVKDGKLGAKGKTIWISFVAFCEGGGAWSLVEFRDGNTEKLKLGHTGESKNWCIIDTAFHATSAPITQTTLLVMRIDFASPKDQIYVWTNPELGTEPDIEKADVKSSYRDASFNTVVLRGDANDDVRVDELRIGTTWADVSKAKE